MPELEYDLSLDGEGDVAIYVLSRSSGEGNDRQVIAGDYLLTESEQRDILTLNNKYEKFMLVLNVGGPIDISPVQEVKNILVLSQLGVETGAVLADILLGKSNPSGKLTTTWAKAENYPNIGNFGDINDTYYKEGIYVGYRWFDVTNKDVIYPFGYGLNYSEFSIADYQATLEGKKVIVSATITNIGKYPGKETLQAYLACPIDKLDKPVKDLVGFTKTKELAPNESQQVTVGFDLADFASYDEQSTSYILEKGLYTILCGNSSDNLTAVVALSLQQTITTSKVASLLGNPGFVDWIPQYDTKTYEVPIIPIDASCFEIETITYNQPVEIDSIVEKMSDEELCLMNIGAFDPKGGLTSVIGSASTSVAGGAGETTSNFKNRGISNIVMADGPAGLRISEQYYEDEKGVHAIGSTIPETILDYLPSFIGKLMFENTKVPKDAVLQQQYCTAIPIGTAIAQSFNLDFAESCGEVVGSEMQRFGVNLWLAPALNIHRSVLCGRNYEYYSEDPIVSGLFAAALCKGVQSKPNCGVTLKHFAANNQETNRYFSNSHVSQRAMREIYLKGFKIAIREAKPKAIMASYNLLNGIHTSESKDLCTYILRDEFGFKGVCMTDWIVQGIAAAKGSKYTVPSPSKIAEAGGDLFMPGSKNDYKKLMKGLKAGEVSKQALQVNATRVYRLAKELSFK